MRIGEEKPLKLNMKIKLSKKELLEHLEDQKQFLKASCDSFDAGFTGEFKRIAIAIRLLLHQSRHSNSLLDQLDMKESILFLSTAYERPENNHFSYNGLVLFGVKKGMTKYIAPLDDSPNKKTISFNDWWQEAIIVNDKGKKITREVLIRTASDQDGGAHVDSELDETYARLSKGLDLGVTFKSGNKISLIENPERVAIRQIGHEVLKSLDEKYTKMPNDDVDFLLGGISVNSTLQPEQKAFSKKIGRNDRCPCGSNLKYKKCHGKGV